MEKGFKLICGNCNKEYEINGNCLHTYAWGVKRQRINDDTAKQKFNIWVEEDEKGIVIECKCGNILLEL